MIPDGPLFTKPLQVPREGEKVYELTPAEIEDISGRRERVLELRPGMAGLKTDDLAARKREGAELIAIDFAYTKRCNFKCGHCYQVPDEMADGRKTGSTSLPVLDHTRPIDIPFEVLERVTGEAVELGVDSFIITGGEPMIRGDYFRIVDMIGEKAEGKGLEAKILTFSDVALINQDKAEGLAERGISLCLKLDTLNPLVQEGILKTNFGLTQMMRGYKNLFAAGYGKEEGLRAVVNTVLRKGEFNTLHGSVDTHVWVRGNGMDHSIVPIHNCGEATGEEEKNAPHPVEVHALYSILAKVDEYLFGDKWTPHSAFPKDETCLRPGWGVHVRPTGEITACSESPKDGGLFVFGNIYEDDLRTVIRSDKFQKFRGDFEKREGTYICNPNACDLNAYDACRSGCATRSAYTLIDSNSGLVISNPDHRAYVSTEGGPKREDPLCPGWAVLAQKQGVLKEGVYDAVVDQLLNEAVAPQLTPELKEKIKGEVKADFAALRNTMPYERA